MEDILASMADGNRRIDEIEVGAEKRFNYTLENSMPWTKCFRYSRSIKNNLEMQ